MKTHELSGAELDQWVARAEGVDAVLSDMHRNGTRNCVTFYRRDEDGFLDGRSYCPSEHWSDGGPIIERERIWIAECSGAWSAKPALNFDKVERPETWGSTPLEAAMRCFVASKFGDEVDTPTHQG